MLSYWSVYLKLIINKSSFSPLYFGNPLTNIFAINEDPDEMQHNAAFHQGLHCL